ncbi:hypothetical protein Q9966_013025 [Columba livia]|nr:hypothetical protein Q9966_013025 [Columba livia]
MLQQVNVQGLSTCLPDGRETSWRFCRRRVSVATDLLNRMLIFPGVPPVFWKNSIFFFRPCSWKGVFACCQPELTIKAQEDIWLQ